MSESTSSHDSVLEEVRRILADVTREPIEKIRSEATLQGDLEADSLDLVDLNMQIEDAFGISVDVDGLIDEYASQTDLDWVDGDKRTRLFKDVTVDTLVKLVVRRREEFRVIRGILAETLDVEESRVMPDSFLVKDLDAEPVYLLQILYLMERRLVLRGNMLEYLQGGELTAQGRAMLGRVVKSSSVVENGDARQVLDLLTVGMLCDIASMTRVTKAGERAAA